LAYDLRTFGTLTAYDLTGESTAFRIAFLLANARQTVVQLTTVGLLALLPLGVAGVLAMAFRHRRGALVLALWIAPPLVLYTSYYWALEHDGVHYVRFFLTTLPAFVLAASWLLWQPVRRATGGARTLAVAAVTLLVLANATLGVRTALPLLRLDRRERLDLLAAERALAPVVPAGSVVIGPQPELLHL